MKEAIEHRNLDLSKLRNENVNSENNRDRTSRLSGPRIYFGIGILCLLVSVYTSTNLLSLPVGAWQPIDVAEALFGFLMFLFLSWFGLTSEHARAQQGARVASMPPLPSFFVRALVVGLGIGAAIAYWQGAAMGWSIAGSAGLAAVVTVISAVVILILLRMVRRRAVLR